MAGIMQEYLAEAGGILTACQRFASDFQYGRYMDSVTEASMCAERLTERLRRMALGSMLTGKEQENYRLRLVQAHRILVGCEDGVLWAELPFLLPHRKKKYTDYIYEPLYTALQVWCLKQEETGAAVPVYQEAVICFFHVYDKGKPAARIRDHDNVEEKQVTDALGTFFLESDGGLYLDTYHTSALGEADKTVVFLMEKQRFPGWLNRLDRGKLVSKNMAGGQGKQSTG